MTNKTTTRKSRLPKLVHMLDDKPGITRRRSGRGFAFFDASGTLIADKQEIRRIKSLGIPPAWRDVWIAPTPLGYIQAIGRDAKGRKQYRYHNQWNEQRSSAKFERMADFATNMTKIREQVNTDLNKRGLPRPKVIALLVSILESTYIRIGNTAYARDNNSYGLTTLEDDHVQIDEKGIVRFAFRGKSGVDHELTITDRRLAKLILQARDMPGSALFQFIDKQGSRHRITSADVNSYLREVTGAQFSAKDFRTWGGSLLAVQHLLGTPGFTTERELKHNINEAVRAVSKELGNTMAICRKYYIHPTIFETYSDGSLVKLAGELQVDRQNRDQVEEFVLTLLKAQAKAKK